MKKYKLFMLTLLFAGVFASCSSEDDSVDESVGTAKVSVELTDAPGNYDEVWVEIVDVMIQLESETELTGLDEEGWVSLGNINTGTYDLLTLTGGMTEVLADSEIPAGTLQQMRLVLGSGNEIVVDGVSYTLKTPSADQSGLKLNVNEELEAGKNYNFILDFDVAQSVVKTGDTANYNLKPVIRVSAEEKSGTIVGAVHPTDHTVLVTAENSTTTVSAYSGAEGKFMLHGLPEGTYQVTITPNEESGISETVINDVKVEVGNTTDLEVLFLE